MDKLKNILKVSIATVGSRVLGLVRDALSMAYMSIGAVSSAYTFAFSLPNLFRRLLGEGALSGAVVPVFSKAAKTKSLQEAYSFLNKTTTRALIAMTLIVAVGVAIAACAMFVFSPDAEVRFFLGAKYSVVLFPYLIFICVAAVFTSVLNVLDSFGVPSITPMILNFCIIASLFVSVAICGASDIENIAFGMCFGWLIGGFLQMAIPAYCLCRKGWKFKFDLGVSDDLKSLYALFFPALIGAAVVQLNIFISKLLAFNLNDEATPALYISSRILEFPLGVFSVAIATVYFPRLAKLAAQGSSEDFKKEYDDGLIASMAISIPAMFGIIVLAREILGLLFQWGLFGVKDVDICLPVMIAAVLGLPFFAFTTFATRGFHSNSDTKTPVKISYVSIALNIVLSIALMFKFGAVGLALANVAAAIFSSVALHFALKKRFVEKSISEDIAKIIVASLCMSAVCWGLKELFAQIFVGKFFDIICCCGIVPIGAIVYIVFLKFLRFKKLGELKRILKRR